MKKQLLTLLTLLLSFSATMAQVTGVSTTPENKKAILEEFSGVRCPNCPAGHTVAADILAANPGNVFVVAYHPNNSSYTPPYSGDEDFQRSYPAAFYATPFCGSSRFMPSAFINRREWSTGEKISSRGIWDASCTTIMGESSPLNVGIQTVYNENTQLLTVTVEVYYTANVNDFNDLYVNLTEDNLITQTQSGATGPYTHHHTFREGLAAQWGDAVTDRTLGSFNSFTYYYDNSTTNYDMSNCEVVAFVENNTTEEIYSGMGEHVTVGVAIDEPASGLDVTVYPNPFSNQTAVIYQLNEISKVSYRIFDVVGSEIQQVDLGEQNSGSHRIDLEASQLGLSSGIYFIKVVAGEKSNVQRIVVQ